MANVLEAIGAVRSYELDGAEMTVLHGVDLAVRKGEMLAIIGPSGSGKSTLMHLIGLLDKPTKGRILVEGQDTAEMSPNDLSSLRNKHIGFVFQAFNLLQKTSAIANVELPLIYAGVSATERRRRAKGALERVGLGHRLDHHSNQLSGGQQQRVAIARALVTNPSIVLGDEPTGNLDSRSGVEVMAMLQELNEQGITVVLVTHDNTVAQHAERIVRIADGRITSDEKVTERIFAKDRLAALQAEGEAA